MRTESRLVDTMSSVNVCKAICDIQRNYIVTKFMQANCVPMIPPFNVIQCVRVLTIYYGLIIGSVTINARSEKARSKKCVEQAN